MIQMRSNFTSVVLGFLLLVSAAGCGGGSEGGGGGSSSGVRILHGALDGSPVKLTVDGEENNLFGRFSLPTVRVSLSTGERLIELRSALNGTTVYSQSVSAVKGGKMSALLYGDIATFGLGGSVLVDGAPVIPEGAAAVRIIHSVVGAASVKGRVGVTALEEAPFGGAGSYVFVQAATLPMVISRSVDGREIYRQDLVLNPANSYSVFVTGDVNYLVIGRVLED